MTPSLRVAIPARLSSGDDGDERVLGANRLLHDIAALVQRTGLAPVVVNETVDLDDFAGVVLPGGGDLDPSLYGGEPCDALYDVNPDQDALDLAIARAALASGTPALGICRGAQVLNVAAGGTLERRPRPEHGGAHPHSPAPGEALEFIWHAVGIAPSRLRDALGADAITVATGHHQGIAIVWERRSASRPPSPPTGSSRRSRTSPAAVLGVQWHPGGRGQRPQAERDAPFLAPRRGGSPSIRVGALVSEPRPHGAAEDRAAERIAVDAARAAILAAHRGHPRPPPRLGLQEHRAAAAARRRHPGARHQGAGRTGRRGQPSRPLVRAEAGEWRASSSPCAPSTTRSPKSGSDCGHNVIAGAALGAFTALVPMVDDLGVTVRLLGTPAEENAGGKVTMLDEGAFDGTHAALMVHPRGCGHDRNGHLRLGSRSRPEFVGREAHASASPIWGSNALDALTIMSTGSGGQGNSRTASAGPWCCRAWRHGRRTSSRDWLLAWTAAPRHRGVAAGDRRGHAHARGWRRHAGRSKVEIDEAALRYAEPAANAPIRTASDVAKFPRVGCYWGAC